MIPTTQCQTCMFKYLPDASGCCPRCTARALREELDGTVVEGPPDLDGAVDGGHVRRLAEAAASVEGVQVLEVLGQGGMGVVFRARQSRLGRDVAVKMIPGSLLGEADLVARFEREAVAMAALSHPGIVGLHEYGLADGHPYLVMAYVEGPSLRAAMTGAPWEPDAAIDLALVLCDALHYAHEQGVVHRDVKPANILIDADGRPLLTDFGLAKLGEGPTAGLTHSRMAMGTPNYMAPEQWSDPLAVDRRADVYALGVLLYELLTGDLPLGNFASPGVSRRLDAVVLRALSRDPGERFATAAELADALVAARLPSASDLPLLDRWPIVSGAAAGLAIAAIATMLPHVPFGDDRQWAIGSGVVLAGGLAAPDLLIAASLVLVALLRGFPATRAAAALPLAWATLHTGALWLTRTPEHTIGHGALWLTTAAVLAVLLRLGRDARQRWREMLRGLTVPLLLLLPALALTVAPAPVDLESYRDRAYVPDNAARRIAAQTGTPVRALALGLLLVGLLRLRSGSAAWRVGHAAAAAAATLLAWRAYVVAYDDLTARALATPAVAGLFLATTIAALVLRSRPHAGREGVVVLALAALLAAGGVERDDPTPRPSALDGLPTRLLEIHGPPPTEAGEAVIARAHALAGLHFAHGDDPFTADSRRLLLRTARGEGPASLIEVESGRTLRALGRRVRFACLSPDGERAFLIEPDTQTVVETRTGRTLANLIAPDIRYRSVAIAPDGRTLLAAGRVNSLLVRLRDGEARTLGVAGPPLSAQFDGRGERLLLRTARALVLRGEGASQASAPPADLADLAADGRHVAVARGRQVALLDATLAARWSVETAPPVALHVAPDGSRVIVRTAESVELRAGADGARQMSARATDYRVGPGGRRLLLANPDGLSVRDIAPLSAPRPLADSRDARGMTWSPDGFLVAAIVGARVRVWDLARPDLPRTYTPRKAPGGDGFEDARHLVFSRDGRRLLVGDGRGRGWIYEGPRLIATLLDAPLERLDDGPRPAFLGSRGDRIVARGPRGFRIWSVPEGEPLHDIEIGQRPATLLVAADGSAFATAGAWWSADDGARRWPESRAPEGATRAAFSPDASQLALERGRGGLDLWSVGRQRRLRHADDLQDTQRATLAFLGSAPLRGAHLYWPLPGPPRRALIDDPRRFVVACGATPRGRRCWAIVEENVPGAAGYTARIRERDDPRWRTVALGATPVVASVAPSRNGRWLVLGHASQPARIRLWQTTEDRFRRSFLVSQINYVTRLAVSNDGRWIAHYLGHGSRPGLPHGQLTLIRARDGKTFAPAQGHHARYDALRFSPDGRTLAASGEDGTTLFRIASGDR